MRYKGPVLERVAEVEKFAFVLSFRRDLALLTTFVKGLEGGGWKRGELWDGLATGWCSEAEKQRAGGGADCWWALLEAPRGWLWLNHRNPGELLKGASVYQRKTVCFLLRFLFTSCLLCLFLLQLPAPRPCRRCADAASALCLDPCGFVLLSISTPWGLTWLAESARGAEGEDVEENA